MGDGVPCYGALEIVGLLLLLLLLHIQTNYITSISCKVKRHRQKMLRIKRCNVTLRRTSRGNAAERNCEVWTATASMPTGC